MRFTRMFLLPFACLGLLAALTVFSLPRAIDYGPTAVTYDIDKHFDLTMPVALIERAAIVEEASAIAAPIDAHRVVYQIANQPLNAWRMTADAYRHIDPGRMAV